MDALNDRELRHAVLIQNPLTMEAAYNVATQFELIDAYGTPVRKMSPVRTRVRHAGVESETPTVPQVGTDQTVVMAKRLAELEEAMLRVQQQATDLPKVPFNETVRPPVQNSRLVEPVGTTHGGEFVHNTREPCAPSNKSNRSSCYDCGKMGTIAEIAIHHEDPIPMIVVWARTP